MLSFFVGSYCPVLPRLFDQFSSAAGSQHLQTHLKARTTHAEAYILTDSASQQGTLGTAAAAAVVMANTSAGKKRKLDDWEPKQV